MTLGRYQPTPTTKPSSTFSNIPWWGWVAGIGVVVVVFLVMRSRSSSSSSGVVSPGASGDNTQQLADLENSLQQLVAQSGIAASDTSAGYTGSSGSSSSGSSSSGSSSSGSSGSSSSGSTDNTLGRDQRGQRYLGPPIKKPPTYHTPGILHINPTPTVTSSRTSNTSFIATQGTATPLKPIPV